MPKRSAVPRVCEDCGREVLGKYKRRRCENCYRAVLRREKGILPRAEWEERNGIRRLSGSPLDRLFGQAVAGPDGCVIFTGKRRGKGYGYVSMPMRGGVSAHRLAYELMVGPIPAGMDIDHQCHNRSATCPGGPTCLHRRCVNPHHLEPATSAENTRRAAERPASRMGRRVSDRDGTSCRKGHPRTPENTAWERRSADSERLTPRCKVCRRASDKAFRKRRRAAA